MSVPPGYGLRPLVPELILLAAAVAALFVHLFARTRGRRAAGYIALAGIGAAGTALVLTPPSAEALFGGHFIADPFAAYLKAAVLLAGALALVLAFRFFDVEGREPGETYPLMLLAMVGMMAAASAADVVTTYVAFELFAIPSYVLAGIFKKESRSAEAGIKYFFLGTLSSAIMLLGLALVFGLTGSTAYAEAGPALAGAGGQAGVVAMGLVFAGLFFKAAFVPFHMWAPDVYEGAPTPLAIFLSTAPKAAVVAVLVRAMTSLFGAQAAEWRLVLQAVAIATMFWGNLAALAQKSLKRMLGYSAIAQAGYLAIGLAAWGETGRTAVLFYTVVYVVMNAAAFGLILLVDRGGRFDETFDGLRGLARRAPLASAAALVVLLSLTGIPPTAGFMGKYFLFTAAVEQGMVPLATAGALNSVISLFYYFRVGKVMFLEEAADGVDSGSGPRPLGAISRPITVFLAACAVALLLIGLLPGLLTCLAIPAVLAP
jgi:NADH-quinone oxidoreductase subunit N